MEQVVTKTGDYNIFRADKSVLQEVAAFVVRENYSHHLKQSDPDGVGRLVEDIFQEECRIAETSEIYVVRNHNDRLIGCIRSNLWDKETELPMEKIFGINPLTMGFSRDVSCFWHIGRLAINREGAGCAKSILQRLISIVLSPIKAESSGCLLAEVDRKLFNNLNRLGVPPHQLAPGIVYLASETIPIYSYSEEIRLRDRNN